MTVRTTLRLPSANVQHYGAAGDGATNDRAAFVAAAAAAYAVVVPYTANGYVIGSAWTVPAQTRILGDGPRRSRIRHGFNGDFLTMAEGAVFEHLWIDGQGATYTGKGLLFTGTDGRQKLLHCQVTDFADFCLDFATNAGSQSTFLDCELWQTDGTTAGKYAVNISATQQLTAKPRKFVGIETDGKKFINLGGSNDTFITASFVGEVKWTAESRAVLITGSRVGANELLMDVDGHNNAISGCDISPAITVLSGADAIAIQGNTYNHAPYVTDNSGNADNNLIDTWTQSFTPALTSANGDASLGNGTLTGSWARSGSVITATVALTLGSTTSMGTGAVRLSVPLASTVSVQAGSAIATDSSASTTFVFGTVLSALQAFVTFRSDGGTTVSSTAPFTWATGDTLRVTMSYLL